MDTAAPSTGVPTGTADPRRHGAHAWLRRLGVGTVAVVLALAVGGLAYQASATALEQRRYPAPGRMVRIGGHRLHLYCTGANVDDRATVILEQGGGGHVLAWYLVQPAVARFTRACAYDRAGQGWSEPGPGPRDGAHIAQDLHTLMANAGIAGPFVVAGHSYGGLFARAFASRYPDEVAGLVLLDAAHPAEWTRTAEGRARYAADSKTYRVARVLARFGLLRLGPNPFAAPPADWPAERVGEWRALANTTRFWDTTAAESSAILETMAQLRAAPPLPPTLPVMVVTAGLNTGADGRWREYQEELAALTANSDRVVVEGASHEALWADRRHVPATSAAILRVVEAARTGAPLAGD